MRVVVVVWWLALASASAQTILDPSRLTPTLMNFEPGPNDKPMGCSVTPIRPALNFSLRFQAGYVVQVAARDFAGKGHIWAVLVRLTPEGEAAKPVHLFARLRLPEVPDSKVQLEWGGGYLLGPGRYQVAWKMMDERGRVCRKDWQVDARLSHQDRKVKLIMEPGAVAELSLRGVKPSRQDDDAARLRLTVFLHAAPGTPWRTSMGARDRLMLIGTLSAMLERLPVRSVRLVVFNLDQQRELFRHDGFLPQQMSEVAQSMNQLQLGLVDYRVLQNRGGHVQLLADLLKRELAEPQPSDVILFVGPPSRFWDNIPSEQLEKPQEATPKILYLQYRASMRPTPIIPDLIAHAVSRLRGKTLIIRTPGDFAKALEQVERR